jgi:tetratricopeptide (TPR) repeat protein
MSENTIDAHPVQGVFTTEAVTTVGFGATKRRVVQIVYVYVEQTETEEVSCRVLNEQFIATGKPRIVSREDLFSKFVPAPDVYLNKYLPARQALERAVDSADQCRQEGQLFTAEFEYKNALRLDENHIRASFGLGLTYLEHGDAANASMVFRKLATLKGVLDPEFKHLFNEFGIQLRKNRLYAEAVRHYSQAVKLCPDDENLWCNLARALYEKGRVRAAKRFLDKALAVRPDFAVARKFKAYIEDKSEEIVFDEALVPPGVESLAQRDPVSMRSEAQARGEPSSSGPKAEKA